MEPKFPDVKVKLVGEDGNAFSILGRVKRAMNDAGVEHSYIDDFIENATSGDYNHLLQVVMDTVSVDDSDDEEDYDEEDDDGDW